MNNFKYAKKRDAQIIEALENYQCLDTFQLALMFFPSQKMARKRMLDLFKKKKVKRIRLEIDQPNVYYLDKFDNDMIRLNWVRLYLEKKCAAGDKAISFDYEKLILTYENPLTKQKRQTIISFNQRKLDFGGNVFRVNDERIDELREVLLCGQ